MTKVQVKVLATDPWNQNYSGSTSLNDIKQTVEDIWNQQISDGSGDYSINVNIIDYISPSESDIQCNSDCNLWDRADEIDEWCQSYSYDTYYNYTDVYVVADHWGKGVNGMSGAAQEHATYYNKVTVVDYDSSLASHWQNDGHELLHVHELLHMFINDGTSEHYPDIHYSGNATVMCPGDTSEITSKCDHHYSPQDIIESVSDCTQSKVRNYIDNYM